MGSVNTTSVADQDKELLDTGLFSDVTVTCGDSEWKLHRAILSTRSDWFRAALCGNFDEAESRIINLHEQNPDIVRILIEWIYIRDRSEPDKAMAYGNEIGRLENSIELLRAADFFCLSDLRLICEEHIQECYKKLLLQLDTIDLIVHDRSTDEELILQTLAKTVKVVYELRLDTFKSCLVGPVVGCHLSALRVPAFRDILNETPQYAVDLLYEIPKQIDQWKRSENPSKKRSKKYYQEENM
ncbi:BTB/POZ protein [Xylariaceae sp. FL1651]|nr:BTB/POZ protein [Xylariaceae sp. FL1651]